MLAKVCMCHTGGVFAEGVVMGYIVEALQALTLTYAMQEKYTNAFLGGGPEETNFAVELTYNYGVDSYDLGEGFGHFALGVDDVYETVAKIKADGK